MVTLTTGIMFFYVHLHTLLRVENFTKVIRVCTVRL
jgi:hypothetical protein